jgi:hypothetical protein
MKQMLLQLLAKVHTHTERFLSLLLVEREEYISSRCQAIQNGIPIQLLPQQQESGGCAQTRQQQAPAAILYELTEQYQQVLHILLIRFLKEQ